MTKKELANKYKVSTRTLTKWLKPIEAELKQLSGSNSYIYNPKQIKRIIEFLGNYE